MVMSDYYENGINEGLFSFLRENEFSGIRLQLLLFWGKHPQTSFNLDGIARILNLTHQHLKELLKDLIDKGMINEHYCSSGIAHYSLNNDHESIGHIQKLAALDCSVINSIQGELESEVLSA